MTTKLEQAARQALEVLAESSGLVSEYKGCHLRLIEAAKTLREALAEQAEQEPVIGAYEVVNEKGDEWSLVYPAAVHRYKSIPEERITQTFYAAPVRTKDLTDDEILPDGYSVVTSYDGLLEFARAAIAADREKNK